MEDKHLKSLHQYGVRFREIPLSHAKSVVVFINVISKKNHLSILHVIFSPDNINWYMVYLKV